MTGLRVGFIGLGAMGMPMARRLLARGHALTVWGRTAEKLAPILAAGAQAAASPRAVAEASDIVALCVFDAAAVAEVVFGTDGIAQGGAAGKLLVDHSTAHPARTREMAARLMAETGMGWVDAPVSGGVKGAEDGTLIVMAGGAAGDIARTEPLLSAYAKRITRMGPVGAGQASKVCNQIIIGASVAVCAEALNFAHRFGVNAADLPDCLAGGWADSAVLQNHARRMVRHERDLVGPGLMQKDMDAALDVARTVGAPMPVTGLVAELYRLVAARTGESGQTSLVWLYIDPQTRSPAPPAARTAS